MCISRISNLLFFLFFLTFTFSFFAQDVDEEIDDVVYTRIKPKHTLTLELGLPIGMANKGFKEYLQGMVNFSPYYHFNFQNNLSIGIGVNYNLFKINHVLSPDVKNLGAIHSIGSFLEVGYEKFYTDRLGVDLSIKSGFSKLYLNSVNNKSIYFNIPTQLTNYIEPNFSFILSADEYTAYRWMIGYVIQNYKFDPTRLGFKSTKEISTETEEKNKLTQFLTFGFGFSYYFNQR
jgi:hypothetical protein